MRPIDGTMAARDRARVVFFRGTRAARRRRAGAAPSVLLRGAARPPPLAPVAPLAARRCTVAQVLEPIVQPFPNSRKVYLTGSRPDIRVPVREIHQAPTSGRFGQEANPRSASTIPAGRTPIPLPRRTS